MTPLTSLFEKKPQEYTLNQIIDFLVKNENKISSIKFYKYRVAINYRDLGKKYIDYNQFKDLLNNAMS